MQDGRQGERRHAPRRIRDIFDGFTADQQADVRRGLDRRRAVRRASDLASVCATGREPRDMEPDPLLDPSRPTVLVVDDVEATRAGLAELLRLRGYNALQAGNGADALAMLDAHPHVHAVVLDLGMPEFDGRWFRERQLQNAAQAAVPVIVFTASAVSDDVLRQLHVSEVMTKPFSVDRLFERLEHFVCQVREHDVTPRTDGGAAEPER